MLNKVRGGSSEMAAFVREADRMIRTYGWENADVHPYSYAVKVTKVVDDLRDYDACTEGTKSYLVALANGLVPILNAWEAYEKEPMVLVRVVDSGKVISCREGLARDMVDGGVCAYV